MGLEIKIVFMMAILKNKMASTDRKYSPLYIFFAVIAEDRPPIPFLSCTVTSIECNDFEISFKIDF